MARAVVADITAALPHAVPALWLTVDNNNPYQLTITPCLQLRKRAPSCSRQPARCLFAWIVSNLAIATRWYAEAIPRTPEEPRNAGTTIMLGAKHIELIVRAIEEFGKKARCLEGIWGKDSLSGRDLGNGWLS